MQRAERLLDMIQSLRRRRRPVTAETLASELDVSVRTVYRDIGALVRQGVPVRGEAGIGYVLDAGFDLPPLMFSPDEIEAVLLLRQPKNLAPGTMLTLGQVVHWIADIGGYTGKSSGGPPGVRIISRALIRVEAVAFALASQRAGRTSG